MEHISHDHSPLAGAEGHANPEHSTVVIRHYPVEEHGRIVRPQAVLLVSAVEAAQACAAEIGQTMDCDVDIAESRKSAIAMLRRQDFSAVVVDDALAEGDIHGADQLWSAAGLAVPIQVNFAISSCGRVVRDLRAALYRRQLDEKRARTAAETNLQADIGSSLTGIVLELDLLRSGADIPPEFRDRLTQLTDLTTELRRKLVPTLPPKSSRSAVQDAIGMVKTALRTSAAHDAESAAKG
jgi:hypothetical protein